MRCRRAEPPRRANKKILRRGWLEIDPFDEQRESVRPNLFDCIHSGSTFLVIKPPAQLLTLILRFLFTGPEGEGEQNDDRKRNRRNNQDDPAPLHG